jgi:hypothetical protein
MMLDQRRAPKLRAERERRPWRQPAAAWNIVARFRPEAEAAEVIRRAAARTDRV